MAEEPTFTIGDLDEILDMNDEFDMDEETMRSLLDDFGDEEVDENNEFAVLHEINASTSNDEALKELAKALETEQLVIVPKKPRFKSLSDEDLKEIDESRQSKSTKKKTKWGVKILQGR